MKKDRSAPEAHTETWEQPGRAAAAGSRRPLSPSPPQSWNHKGDKGKQQKGKGKSDKGKNQKAGSKGGKRSTSPWHARKYNLADSVDSVKDRVHKLEQQREEDDQAATSVNKSLEVVGGRLDRHRAAIDKLHTQLQRAKAQIGLCTTQIEHARRENLSLRKGMDALCRRTLPEGEMLTLMLEAEAGAAAAESKEERSGPPPMECKEERSGPSPMQRPEKEKHKSSKRCRVVKEEEDGD